MSMFKGISKKWLVLCSALFIMMFALAGCNTAEETPKKEEPKTETEAPKEEATAPELSGNLILATTTSTQDSGLLDVLVPLYEEQTGVMVKTIAVGSGKALEMGKMGEADALLVHAPADEELLEQSGDVVNRELVMHNDFIIVGPKEDPAGIKGMAAPEALKKIMESGNIFVSRGDDSGTHKKELSLWKKIEITPEGQYYQETGQGMGETLKLADQKGAYTMTDRATYLSMKDEMAMEILLEGDDSLLNIYHVMQVAPEKSEKINADAAEAFVSFMIDEETQSVINDFGKQEYGQSLFFPDAKK